MLRYRYWILLGALSLCSFTGCLSLGGTIVHEDPSTTTRLDSLEARVSSLEQTIGTHR